MRSQRVKHCYRLPTLSFTERSKRAKFDVVFDPQSPLTCSGFEKQEHVGNLKLQHWPSFWLSHFAHSTCTSSIIIGMPQGSFLGPLTFIILTDDLRANCLTHKFIDDTTLTEIIKKNHTTYMQSSHLLMILPSRPLNTIWTSIQRRPRRCWSAPSLRITVERQSTEWTLSSCLESMFLLTGSRRSTWMQFQLRPLLEYISWSNSSALVPRCQTWCIFIMR